MITTFFAESWEGGGGGVLMLNVTAVGVLGYLPDVLLHMTKFGEI